MRLFKSKKLIAGVVVLGLVGAGSTAALITRDTPKEEVKYVATPQKAKVMKDDSIEVPVVESENTAVVTSPEQPTVVDQTDSPVTVENPKSNNPYPIDSPHGYVYDKREKAGKTVGIWGPARLWVQYARAAGVVVDKTPQIGDAYSVGDHLYYVEAVNENSITVSTYLNGVNSKEMSREEASIGWFIH